MNAEQKKYTTCTTAILAVFAFFREKADNLMGPNVPEPRDSPIFIEYNTVLNFLDVVEFNVYVDGMKVCETSDFIGAFMTLLCSFYVFNTSFPKTVQKSVSFFASVMINVADRGKETEKRRRSLISRLHALTRKNAL